MMRRIRPICGPASPTPGAASMVSCMSAAILRNPASTCLMRIAFCRRRGSPSRTMSSFAMFGRVVSFHLVAMCRLSRAGNSIADAGIRLNKSQQTLRIDIDRPWRAQRDGGDQLGKSRHAAAHDQLPLVRIANLGNECRSRSEDFGIVPVGTDHAVDLDRQGFTFLTAFVIRPIANRKPNEPREWWIALLGAELDLTLIEAEVVVFRGRLNGVVTGSVGLHNHLTSRRTPACSARYLGEQLKGTFG